MDQFNLKSAWIMLRKFLFIFVIGFFLKAITDLPQTMTFNKVVVKSLVCKSYVNYIHNLTCILKPIRNGPGNVTIYGFVSKPLHDLWVHLTVYYKFRVFQKFMASLDFNVCELTSGGTNESPIKILLLTILTIYKSYNIFRVSYTEDVWNIRSKLG